MATEVLERLVVVLVVVVVATVDRRLLLARGSSVVVVVDLENEFRKTHIITLISYVNSF